jgi:valyl-tRNA synthetase
MLKTPEEGSDYIFESLVTGWDLIFFWFIKMNLVSLLVKGKRAFKRVLFHGLIVDSSNRKMSKSLGNVIDPAEEIKEKGHSLFRLSAMLNISNHKYMKHTSHQEAVKLINKI